MTRFCQRLGVLIAALLMAPWAPTSIGTEIGTDLGTATATAATLPAAPPSAAPGAEEEGGQLLRLLRYAPRGNELVNFGNLAGLKRRIGADVTRRADVPLGPVARREGEPLTARQEIGRAWWWDVGRQIPVSPYTGLGGAGDDAWAESFGFDVYTVDRELQVGQPPDWYSVIEGAIDAEEVGRKLTALDYAGEGNPFLPEAVLYERFGDREVRLSDQASRWTLGKLNRILTVPGGLIAAPTTGLVETAVDSAIGRRPSLADDPTYRVLTTAMEDPDLLSGTTLLGATLLGGRQIASLVPPIQNPRGEVGPDEGSRAALRQRAQERLAGQPALPPYRAIGLGYRRGDTLADRYWLFTLVYDDVPQAEEAGRVLDERIASYHSLESGEPLLPTYIRERLPAVVWEYEDGVALSVLLRCVDDRPAGWNEFLSRRDLAFLAPGRIAP